MRNIKLVSILTALILMALAQSPITQAAEVKSYNGYKCLDAYGFGTANGTPIVQWDCVGGSNQQWQLVDGQLIGHGGKCLDVAGFGRDNGTPVQLWDCHGGDNQKWYINQGQVISVFNGKCLDVSAVSPDNGATIWIWDCWGGPNQKWKIY